MTHDYRVTVRGDAFERFDVIATRPAVAATRALDLYQRAHRGDRSARLFVELERVGVHKRGPCASPCTAYTGSALSRLDPGTAPRCGAPCTGLENHRTLHRCAEHGTAGHYARA